MVDTKCMDYGIEHPDHTGASSNPDAPWNQPDALPLSCDYCGHETEDGFEGQDCPECLEGTLGIDEPEPPCRCPGDKCYC